MRLAGLFANQLPSLHYIYTFDTRRCWMRYVARPRRLGVWLSRAITALLSSTTKAASNQSHGASIMMHLSSSVNSQTPTNKKTAMQSQ